MPETKSEKDLTPIWDYDPNTIGQALRLIRTAYEEQPKLREVIGGCESADEFSTRMHFGAGRAIRNNWKLWAGIMHNESQEIEAGPREGEVPDPSPLHDHIRITTGLTHADDQSGLLLELFYGMVTSSNETFGETAWRAIKRVQEHWEGAGAPEWAPINRLRNKPDD